MADDEMIEVNLPFERLPTCACDPGWGDPPTKLKRMECRLRGGPCSEKGSQQEDFPTTIR